MPRLEGKSSNTGKYIVLVLVLLVAVVLILQLTGVFNLMQLVSR